MLVAQQYNLKQLEQSCIKQIASNYHVVKGDVRLHEVTHSNLLAILHEHECFWQEKYANK